MDLFLDFSYRLDCEKKINYLELLEGKTSFDDETITLERDIQNSDRETYYYQFKITDSLYKTIRIITKLQ